MPSHFPNDTEQLRAEIAAAAARLIAEDGVDYGTAKRKAAKQILGNNKVRGDVLPDNAAVEDEVRAYNALFFADTQPARLRHLRELAIRLMRELEPFQPFLTGAVLNGTAGEHSDIHLQLFADSPKDVEIYLLNKGIDFEVSESPHFGGHGDVETLSFLWHNEGVHLALYDTDDLRGGRKTGNRSERASTATVEALLAPDNSSPLIP
ncbi:hypothetical protein GCM10007205_16650 [Oxalicibacterium flavum]|uniref:UDP-N-acetylmuramate--alanine ligase n=1 Tax=Oxalicibacterium flavum TaxID=179467 RepID=A0A8J2UMN6_9BURK|nr:hypothetical protein [Oxalicibacterium flavum]GGC08290.1 hypothetical protein GCM10007205_16650 [Oxalicibacterium flavum]